MCKIDIISHIYPTKHDPSSGIFIQKEAHLISSKYDIEIVIPRVQALPFQSQYYRGYNAVEENFAISDFKYLSIPRRMWPKYTVRNLSRKIIKHLGNSSSDIHHVHWLFPSGLSIPKLKDLGKPIVLTMHGGDWYSNQNKGIDKHIEDALFDCNAITCVGKQLKADIINKFPALKNKVYHIPHGINTKVFKPANSDSDFSHLKWDFSKLNLLCVANLYPVKGVDILIEAFNRINREYNSHLHIVAPRRNPNYTKQLFKLISSFQLDDKITFYKSMSESELIPFYQAADLFISPSRKEGFGLAIAESIACGTPVVVTKSGGPEEIVKNNLGIMVEVEDVASLAEGLQSALNDLKRFDTQTLHADIKRSFSNSSKLENLSNIYDDILS
jgi:glycosyltransferase involved in cell wall biosynthesis